jgi:YD repeat-containing protein
MSMQQPPVRNQSVLGAQVYSHSGEYSPRVVDFLLPGRGLSLEIARKYRSAHHDRTGPLGRGWTLTYDKRLQQTDEGVLYSDGVGGTHLFRHAGRDGAFVSPDGFYAVLETANGQTLLRQQHGGAFVFERPDAGGRLLSIRDRNENAVEFEYRDASVRVRDALGRTVTLSFADDRIVEVRDHGGREWTYNYDHDDRLIAVLRPSMEAHGDRPCVRYSYDDDGRLIAVTDPNGQTFLHNAYDDAGRIVRQDHGAGVYEFEYVAIAERTELDGLRYPINRTHARLKNGAQLILTHGDAGHVVERVRLVSPASLPEGMRHLAVDGKITLRTTSDYNRHGEVVRRTFPAGNVVQWEYAENDSDPRARGNLRASIATPAAGVHSDQDQIVTRYSHEPTFQRRSLITNARGHTIDFQYDARGNLIEKRYPETTVPDLTGEMARPVRPISGVRSSASRITQRVSWYGPSTHVVPSPTITTTRRMSRSVRIASTVRTGTRTVPADSSRAWCATRQSPTQGGPMPTSPRLSSASSRTTATAESSASQTATGTR